MTVFEEIFSGSIEGYEIVPLSVDDEERIQQFLVECSDYQMLESGQPVQPGDAHAYLFDLPPNKTMDDKFTFAIEKDTRIIALLDVLRDYKAKDNWWIGLLLISPSLRGKGLGRQIIDYIIQNLTRDGVREIQLAVLEENEAGLLFWQKMGFQQTEFVYGRRHGLKIHNLLVMSCPLGKPVRGQLLVAKPFN
jgi:GNAT superfamily N-acetyltransferase